jgi:glycosyltransferase involved in cell wall biosynthesis
MTAASDLGATPAREGNGDGGGGGLTIVIPARNAAEYLDEQLDAVLSQPAPASTEVIVVDNGSTDTTVEIARRRATADPRVRVEPAIDRRGANYARNRGVLAARHDRIVFCDADDVVGPDWIMAMAHALEEHTCVTGPIDVAQLNPSWLTNTRGEYSQDGPKRQSGIVPVVPGGNMGLRHATWELVGRFTEDLDTAAEDIEFSMRLHRHGVAVTFAADAVVHYRYRGEAAALFRQGRAYGRSRPWINELLKGDGLPTPSRLAGWKSWVLLVGWLPRVRTRQGRAQWCWIAGNRLGQLEGCVRWRAVWL